MMLFKKIYRIMEDTKKATNLLMNNFNYILIDNIMVGLIFMNKYTQKWK